MKFETFQLERQQSLWENQVEINLSESGVHPLRLDELVGSSMETLGSTVLGYAQTDGIIRLRELVSELYPGSSVDEIVVTNGTSEANYVSALQLLETGDEVVMMVPNYLQLDGIARSLGCRVRPWSLKESDGWRVDLEELEQLVNEKTKLICVCHPNNPTGALVLENDIRSICKIAGKHGAWVLSDEIYRGAELDGEESPTFWGWYERILATAGLAKAYALPGLRIGWVVSNRETTARLWAYKDYTTIASATLSQELACIALEPRTRHRILERTRTILRDQLPILQDWVAAHSEALGLQMTAPQAGAFGLVRYGVNVDSIELTDRLRKEEGVLLVAGAYFDRERLLRIGFGGEPGPLREGLERTQRFLTRVKHESDGS